MKRAVRMFLLVLFAIFIIIQFFQPERSNPPVRAELKAPPAVMAVFRRACYDCHSDETTWPWYSYVNPMGWFVAGHVEEGRRHLNFSQWDLLNGQKVYHAKQEILEQVEEGEMPLKSYLLLHSSAELSTEDRATIVRWVNDEGPR
jgi:Haem-binding domain